MTVAVCVAGVYTFALMDCIDECFLCPENVKRGKSHMETCANWCILTAGKSSGPGCKEIRDNWVANDIAEVPVSETKREKRSLLAAIIKRRRSKRQATADVVGELEVVPDVPQQIAAEVIPELLEESEILPEAPEAIIYEPVYSETYLFPRRKRVDRFRACLSQCVQCVFLYGYGTYDGERCAHQCVDSGGYSADTECSNESFYISFKR